ncbi:MAG: hypothetical protein VB070_09335 [Clostridiaceae bacterium]|nr:hypothetical protein [Clostridiaceae bacterium]
MQGNNQGIKIGWAQIDITPDRPVFNAGQLYIRVSQYVHDPITATALVLDNGADQATLISADMVGVSPNVLAQMRSNLSAVEGLDVQKISFSVTHTHNSSSFDIDAFSAANSRIIGDDILPLQDIPDDIFTGAEATAFLVDKLSELVRSAWENRQPGGISYAQDYAAVAFNRRPVFEEDGQKKTVMYGVCDQKSFKRFEGASDHSADMLYTWDRTGRLTGIAVNIPCPSQVFELHCMITADYWAPTRRQIREHLGNVYILPVCGAAGDQNPLDLVRISKDNKKTLLTWGGQTREVFRNLDMGLECERIGERITEAVLRGYRTAGNYIEMNPVFRHRVISMTLPLRMVTEADYQEALDRIAEEKAKFSSEHRMTMNEVVALFEPEGVILRWERQQQSQTFVFPVHILRLGHLAIATNPFELFCEYGMRMKARSRSRQTMIIQLANENGGYLPTEDALAGGSYSSKPASTKCDPAGGDLLVENTLNVLNSLWSE